MALFDKFVSEENCVIVVSVFSVDSLLSAFSWQHFEEFMMQPLSERTVFSGKFDDFLGDDTSPERAVGRNLSLCISGNIFNETFINLLNFKVFALDFHLLVLVFIDKLNQLLGFIFVQDFRKSVMFGPEVVDSIQNKMKLFRDTELLPTGDGHFH